MEEQSFWRSGEKEVKVDELVSGCHFWRGSAVRLGLKLARLKITDFLEEGAWWFM